MATNRSALCLANGELDLIVFLRDPLTAQPHEPDVSALLRLGDVQKIPLATNVNSATIMLEALKDETFFNKVKEASKTVTLKEVNGSIIECSGAPQTNSSPSFSEELLLCLE